MSHAGTFIVIPVLNRWQQTRQCLLQLRNSTTDAFRIIVVDHGSTDETHDALANEFPEVIRLTGTLDHWWAGATNIGIRFALDQDASTIILLNNDCYVAADTIEILLSHHRQHPEAIIAPVHRTLHSGTIETRWTRPAFLLGFPSLTLPISLCRAAGKENLASTRLIMGGRGTVIPAILFRKYGLLNEQQLPHYWADHDFYLRCHKRGIRQFIACDAMLDIDETTTTMASNLRQMSLGSFIDSFRNRRSHRNIRDLAALFRLHYPVPGLYPLGVALNLVRYSLVYTAARTSHLLLGSLKLKPHPDSKS